MVAKKNAQNLIVGERAKFLVSDWTNGLKGSFDLIFSNPPYIKTGDIQYLQKEVSKFDPIIALDGGKDGLLCYKKILKNIKNYMENNSFFLLEIDPCLSDHIVSFAKSNNLKLFSTKNDLSGQKRCLIFQKL
jgi:release factor glutamine methyltransferase